MKNEENKKLSGDQSGHITLKVKGKDENEVLFRIKRSTQLKKLMTAYCNRQSFDINCVMFLFNGRYLRAEQTPLELDMEDGDEIDALIYVSHDFNHHNDVGNSTNGVVVGNSSSNYVASSSEFDSNLSHDRLHDSGGNDKQAECCSIHLIDEDGTFNAVGLDNFIKKVKLGECGISYAVVAIMGPQSSGKSTLLNHLFHTNFREMDAYQGRSRTTKGIWIAKGAGIDPCTILMDLEGTDGRERGEDDTTFEKQSALFALALSDIVLINMWCHDIGLEQAANKPLLKTVFQVMLRLLIPRKTSLVFVIRDKTRTPLEYLEPVLREDIQKIWDSIPKPEAHKYTPLSRFFNVKVVALSSYEDKEEQFKEQVTSLREKFFQSITPDSLAGDRRGVVPASGFSFSAQQIWKVIKENKGLDLPAHKVMVATVLCEEIVHEKYSSFVANKDWLELQEVAQSQRIPAFGKKLSSLLYNCLSSYDEEAAYFENSVRSVKRKQLEEKLMQLVEPAYQLMLEHILPETLENFKKALNDALNGGLGFAVAARDCAKEFMRIFDEEYAITQAICDLAKVRDTFSCDLNSHIVEIRTAKLSELTSSYESEIKKALYGPVESLLEKGSDDTWPAIRNLLHQETAKAVSEFFFALSGFEIGKQEKEDIISNLKIYSRGLVEGKAREEAGKALYHMKERFTSIFKHDDGSMPRVWTGNEDIQATAKTAQYSSINLLSVLAAIRLDEEIDTIRDTLVLTLMDPKIGNSKSTTLQDPLASSTWEEVSATNTLITPVECKSLWNEFQKEIEYIITQAIASQAMACGQGGTNSSKSNTDEHRTHSSDACQGADDSSSFAGYVDQLDDDIFHPDNIQVGDSRTPEGTPQGCGANQQRDLPEPLDVRELLLFDEDGSIINDSVVRQCTTILKSCFHGPWCYWKDVPEDQRRIMFDRFRGHYRWDPSHEQLVYGRWGSIMGRRYHDFLRDARERAWRLAKQKEGPSVVGDFKKIIPFPPPYIPHKFWREMIESTWDTEKWKAKAKAAKENRNKEYGGASSRHNGGSISFVQHKRRMTKENGFEPTPAELFVRTHTKRRVGEASSSDPVFPYPRAEQALKTYEQGMSKKYGNTDPSSIPVHDPQVWEESVGGRKKGRLFGFVTNARASSIGTSYIPRPPPDVASLEEKIKIVEAQNAEVLARELAREAEVEKLRKQMEEDRKKMEEDRKKWEHEFEQRMENILKQRSGSESTPPPPHPPPI